MNLTPAEDYGIIKKPGVETPGFRPNPYDKNMSLVVFTNVLPVIFIFL